jgi:hypothetical protein
MVSECAEGVIVTWGNVPEWRKTVSCAIYLDVSECAKGEIVTWENVPEWRKTVSDANYLGVSECTKGKIETWGDVPEWRKMSCCERQHIAGHQWMKPFVSVNVWGLWWPRYREQ